MFKPDTSHPPGGEPSRTLAPRPNASVFDDLVCIMGIATMLPGHCVLPRREAQHACMYHYVCGFHTASPGIAFLSRREAPRAHNRYIKWPSQIFDVTFNLGQVGSTNLARLFEKQFLMPGHITSYWRPTIVNSHRRVACLRPMHQFH